MWVLCNAFPQRDRDAELTEVVVTFVDVTERMVVERRLRVRHVPTPTPAES